MKRSLALILVCSAAARSQGASWLEERAAAVKSYQAKDYQGFRAHLQRELDLAGATPSVVYNLACAESLLGHREAALGFLRSWAAMGSVGDPAGEADLAAVQDGLGPVLARVAENRRPVSHGAVVFTLPDKDLLTEDVAYDGPSRTFFVSSVHQRKIVAFRQGGAARDFVKPSPELWSVLGLHVDAPRRMLWATTAAMPQTPGVAKEDRGRSALLAFDLGSGGLLKRFEVPRDGKDHVLGDLTVSPEGAVFVSDSISGVVYRERGKGLEVVVQAGVFRSPQTPALSPDGQRLFVPDYARGIAEVDLGTSRVVWLVHSREVALTGIDGLYLKGTTLVAVQNGTAPARVVRFQLDPALRRVQGFDSIEMNTRQLGSPTHGVIVENEFYFLGNSGWDRAGDNDDSLKPGEPAVLLRVSL